MSRYYLSLGSNIDPEKNLRLAVRALRLRFGEVTTSGVYESEAVGFSGPAFWNMVVGFDSELDIETLGEWTHALETEQGRRRDVPRYSDRTLDVDIIVANGVITRPAELQLAHVLVPLSEVARWARDPMSGLTVEELWESFKRTKPAEVSSLKLLFGGAPLDT